MRKTKIVCTIGPVTRSLEMLERLMVAGMNVARLNFSHGSQEEHAETCHAIRRIAQRLGRPVAILQDLAGPKVRVGLIAAGTAVLKAGQTFTLTSRDVPGDHREVSLTYKGLSKDVQVGDSLLLNDGAIELEAQEVSAEDIHCRIAIGRNCGRQVSG